MLESEFKYDLNNDNNLTFTPFIRVEGKQRQHVIYPGCILKMSFMNDMALRWSDNIGARFAANDFTMLLGVTLDLE